MTEMNLDQWKEINDPKNPEDLIYLKGFHRQLIEVSAFYRVLQRHVSKIDYMQERLYERIKVISSHRSKSVIMPVYELKFDKLTLVLRDNFYNWKVSVESSVDLILDLDPDFFYTTEKINPVYCEGFPEERVYDSYSANKRNFTIEIGKSESVFTFLYLIHCFLKKNYGTSW